MIRKELDPFLSEDKFAKSGRAAEEQMAFYLRRFFERDPEIQVLNGIRIERDGDAAQIDHFIIHPFGFIIIESKSVQGKIQIKDDGQWIRWFNGNQSRGMASPITQAELQGRFLKTTLGLAAKSETLFDSVNLDIFVAISDSGIILWPKAGETLTEVCKADQVASKVTAKVNALRLERNGKVILGDEQIEKLVSFLLAAHRPLELRMVSAPAALVQEVVEAVSVQHVEPIGLAELVCKHCNSRKVEIRYGHNYYVFCLECEKNMPLKSGNCTICGHPEKVRKQAKEFFMDCKTCVTSRLIHTNS